MTNKQTSLTLEQITLRDIAIQQMTATAETLKRLRDITDDQGDREVIDDCQGNLASNVDQLMKWFGQQPDSE